MPRRFIRWPMCSMAWGFCRRGLIAARTIPYLAVALLGGGDIPAPGEISLAHRGILFLDELPEFRRDALEALRQPLEQGVIHIHRARGRATYPSDFLLVAAMNPCPCGFRGHPKKECQCSSVKIHHYIGKISGPLLDRIDLHVELPPLTMEELFAEKAPAESSASVKARVERARDIQRNRYRHVKHHAPDNAHLAPRDMKRYCALNSDGEADAQSGGRTFGTVRSGF